MEATWSETQALAVALAAATAKTPDRSRIVRALLDLHGTTDHDIAEELGCSRQAVTNVVNGWRRSEWIQEHLSNLLGVPVATLFSARCEPPRRPGRPKKNPIQSIDRHEPQVNDRKTPAFACTADKLRKCA